MDSSSYELEVDGSFLDVRSCYHPSSDETRPINTHAMLFDNSGQIAAESC